MTNNNNFISINPLDPSQEHILNSIVNEKTKDDTTIIYGPPGTGKSHLIVSLLFELAVKGNRILFVSQNTEALDVVIRKYIDINNDFEFTDSAVSLLDFCLNLNSSEQRRTRYIKKQGERLRNKYFLPSDNYIDNRYDKVNYPFSYTHLLNSENYNLEGFSRLGMDELLAHKLKNTNNLSPENESHIAMRLPIDMTIRKVFSLLENYDGTNEGFKANNQPTNELKYLSVDVNDLSFESYINTLSDLLSSKDFDDHANICLKSCDVLDYLSALHELIYFSKYFDLHAIEFDSISTKELKDAIENICSAKACLVDSKELKVGDSIVEPLFEHSRKDFESKIKTTTDLYNYKKNFERAKTLIQTSLLERGIKEYSSVKDILSSALSHYDIDFSDQLEVYPWLKDWKCTDLISAIQEIEDWGSLNVLKRNFTRPKWADGKKAAEDFLENKDFWQDTLKCINGTSVTLGEFSEMLTSKGDFGIKDPLMGINSNDDALIEIINSVFALIDICDCDSYSLGDLLALTNKNIADADSVISIIDNNPNVNFVSMVEVLDCANSTIVNNRSKNAIQESWKKISPYLATKSLDELFENGKQIVDYISEHQASINNAFELIGTVKCDSSCNLEDIKNLIEAVSSAKQTAYFTNELFSLEANSNLNLFASRIKRLQNYNTNDIDSFIQHNRFILEIKSTLKDSNKIVDDLLSYSDLSYDDFKERLTSAIISQRYRNYSDAEKISVEPDYTDRYHDIIHKKRRNHYLKGIREMFNRCNEASRDLILNTKWRSARTTIETLRQNTDLIIKAFPIIIATPGEISKYLSAERNMFDYVIFDEASQLLPGQALPAIYRSKRAVIVGDTHQMPPTLSTFISTKTNDFSNDDSILDDDTVSLLDMAEQMNLESSYHLMVHYRSESNVLFEPSRSAIYAKEGIEPIFEAKSDSMPIYIRDNLKDDTNGFTTLLERINHYASINPNETYCILFTTSVMRDCFSDFREEHPELTKIYNKLDSNDKIILSTVTSCQGLDVDHSILYLGYYSHPGAMWFFNEKAGAYKRLNVSITRQKKSFDILIVQDKNDWMSACQKNIDLGDACTPNKLLSSNLLLNLLINAGTKIDDNYLDTKLDSSLSTIISPLAQELLERLNDHYRDSIGTEIKIWHSIGKTLSLPAENIGDDPQKNVGYKIDIGIYSIKKQRFVIGIEMDGSVYHDHYLKNFSDQQRGDILKMKKWNIYRIWSVNWIKNTEDEFNKLISVIDDAINAEEVEEPIELEEEVEESTITEENHQLEQSELDFNEADEDVFIEETPFIDSVIEEPTSVKRSVVGDAEFEREFIILAKKVNRTGQYISIKIDDEKSPMMDILVCRVDDGYIEAKFEPTRSPYKYKLAKIIEFRESQYDF